MERFATAVWHGSGKDGRGAITTQSKALTNAPYAWNTRFEDEKGTNPEELIAAAHAGCFTMKLSFLLNQAGYTASTIETQSIVTLEKAEIASSRLIVKAKVPGMSEEKFKECAERAKNECPVSKAFRMNVSLEARLKILVNS